MSLPRLLLSARTRDALAAAIGPDVELLALEDIADDDHAAGRRRLHLARHHRAVDEDAADAGAAGLLPRAAALARAALGALPFGRCRPADLRRADGARRAGQHLVGCERRGRGADGAGRCAGLVAAAAAADGGAARTALGAAGCRPAATRPGRADRGAAGLGPDRADAAALADGDAVAGGGRAPERSAGRPRHRDRGLRRAGHGAATRRLAAAGLPADRADPWPHRRRGAGAAATWSASRSTSHAARWWSRPT